MNEKNAEVIIIGAGPAGLSAAAWCDDLGLKAIIFEKEAETGGQLLRTFNPVTNYIGIETSNGSELRDVFARTLEKRKMVVRLASEIADADLVARSVVTAAGETFAAHGLIIATGVRRRRLNVPGEKHFEGKGIIESGSNEREKAKDKTVLIVGGGDAALENALILADLASKVYVVHRRPELSARAEFTRDALNHPRIEFRLETVVSAIKGTNKVETVALINNKTGTTDELPIEIVLVRIGVEPNTELLTGKIELDNNGYIVVSSNCETSADGVFAVGDAANPASPTISTAAGTGATAAKAFKAWLNRRVTLQ